MVTNMKKILLTILVLALATTLVACSFTPKLNDEQQKMLDVVMNNSDIWETKEDKYANYIQLQDSGGTYYLCVGYSSDIAQPTDEAVSSLTSSLYHSFEVGTENLVDSGEGRVITPADLMMNLSKPGGGRKLIGNTIWYYSTSSEEKYDQMKSLFLKLLEEK